MNVFHNQRIKTAVLIHNVYQNGSADHLKNIIIKNIVLIHNKLLFFK